MALSKDLQREFIRADQDPRYFLFGDVLQSEDYLLAEQLGGDIKRYEEVATDPHIAAVLQKRAMAIVARDWRIKPADDSESSIAAAELVKSAVDGFNFDELCVHLQRNAQLLGNSEAEHIWEEREVQINGNAKNFYLPKEVRGKDTSRFAFVVPPKDKKLDPQVQYVKGYELRQLTRSFPVSGERLPINKVIHHSYGSTTGNPNGKGVGGVLWWMKRFKTELTKHWLIFCDCINHLFYRWENANLRNRRKL